MESKDLFNGVIEISNQHAEQQAVAFADWIYNNNWEVYSGWGEWINKETLNTASTKHLYQLFLKSQQLQKIK